MTATGRPSTAAHTTRGPAVVIFDIDGTLLDSAPGIVAGFQHALRSVGFEPPDEATLKSDLGPPVGKIFTNLGLPEDDLEAAVLAYRTFYLSEGLQRSTPYDGILDLLDRLRDAGTVLATATAKRTDVAQAIIGHHALSHYFAVVNGTDELRSTKTATLGYTLELLGQPTAERVAMIGDRHSDVTAAEDCGVTPIAVTWGYGPESELNATGATMVSTPADLLGLLLPTDNPTRIS